MAVLASLNELIDELHDPSAEVRLLIESARALALEVDMAQGADENGRTKSAASAVRELRAVVDEITNKGRRADNDDDWSTPVTDLAEVRNVAKPRSGDARSRSRRGGQAAG